MIARSLIIFILLVPFSIPASLAKGKADRKMAERLKMDIYYLASDSLEGRRTGSNGEKLAGDYIEKRYRDIDVDPYNSVYRHPFNFIYGKDIDEGTQIKIEDHVLKIKDEAFPLPFSASKHISAEILPDVMEQGNIWMINLYADQDEANNAHFDAEKTMFERSKDAQKNGATGVIFYDGFGSKWPASFNGLSENEFIDIPVVFLSHDAYKKYVPDDADTTKPKSSIPVDLSIHIKKTQRTGTNMVAFIDNKAPYTVILGAHYDHLGRGEDGNSMAANSLGQIHNGADDNASGTAALLEIAAYVKKNHKKLHHYNYMFINFSGEELGLLGSKNFVKNEKIDSQRTSYMLNMDMVGRLNDSTHSLTIGGVGTSPAWAQFASNPPKEFRFVLDSSGVGPSDHTSFYHEGIPVLFLFTGTHKDYHKPSDDADKINYAGEVEVIKYTEEIIRQMDNSPKPVFTVTKQSTVGRVNFKVTLGIMPDYSFQDGGVRVDGVSENRPAKNAGIKEGDIIIQLGDIKVQGMQSYMEGLSKFKPGDKTNVTVMRAGTKMVLPLEFLK
jgi:aminopeptidase YwaD